MNRILATCSGAVMALTALFSCKAPATAPVSQAAEPLTAQDVQHFQDYLLQKPTTEDLANKPCDRNGDGVWDVYDLSLMKREVQPMEVQPELTSDTLVVYFSRTGNTDKIANYIIDLTDADSYRIEAAVPYTDADIQYQDSTCRANQEQNDKSVRPEIAEPLASIDGYDVIYLGYPIWWGEEPRIIDTFLESFDFSDKTVIPFCTSGSSGISTSEQNIKELVPIGRQLAGRRFPASASEADVQAWLDSLELTEAPAQKLSLTVNGTTLTATLADTQAAAELAEQLKEGTVTVTLNEYGGFEKVGKLPWSLTRTDVQTNTEPGDIMLYQGNQMTIFYESNSWSYTALAKLDAIPENGLAACFGDGDVEVTLSLS